jgi:hypothetical protein
VEGGHEKVTNKKKQTLMGEKFGFTTTKAADPDEEDEDDEIMR